MSSPIVTQPSDPSTQMIDQQPAPQVPPMGAAGLGGPVPQPPQQQTPPQPNQHETMGRVFSALMGNRPQYSVDANGNTVETQVPQKPGQIFRSILAASLLGGAAGADGNPQQGFMGGLVRGGAAGIRENQQQNQQAQQQAQQQFKNQQAAQQEQREQSRTDVENQVSQATLANMHAQTALFQHQNDLFDAETHDKKNAQSRALEGVLLQSGGQLANLPIDGENKNGVITAAELGKAYVTDPKIRQAAPGYQRHFLDTSDMSDIKFNGTHWVQDDGTPVNMSDKTTIKVYDVPNNAMNTAVPMRGSDVLKLNPNLGGSIDPNGTYPLSPTQADGIASSYTAEQLKKAQAKLEDKKVALDGMRINQQAKQFERQITQENRNEMLASGAQIGESIKVLQERLKDPMITKEAKDAADAQVNDLLDTYKSIREKLYPGTTIKKNDLSLPASGPLVTVTMADGKTGQVPQGGLAAFLKKYPGSSAASSGGSTPPAVTPETTPSNMYVVQGPSGPLVVADANSFISAHPEYKLVGQGKAGSEQRSLGSYVPPATPLAAGPWGFSSPSSARGEGASPNSATFDAGPRAGKPIAGLVQRGNIDLNHRPGIKNADGTHSSIFSMTIPIDKDGSVWKGDYEKAPAYALVPSIANGKFLTPDGKKPNERNKKQMSQLEDAATDYYAKTREHLGVFASSDAADKYAGSTHAYMPDGSAKKIYAPSY
jgi:hypothetical protein